LCTPHADDELDVLSEQRPSLRAITNGGAGGHTACAQLGDDVRADVDCGAGDEERRHRAPALELGRTLAFRRKTFVGS